MKTVVSGAAQADIDSQIRYLESDRAGMGAEFLNELKAAFSRLADFRRLVQGG